VIWKPDQIFKKSRLNTGSNTDFDEPRLNEYSRGSVLYIRGPTPDNVVVELYYQDTVPTRNNVGGSVCSWRYRINSCYDPDPLLGTGAVSGFSEWAAMYTHYRVISFAYDVQLSNMESFPLVALCAPTLLDPGANYTGTDQFSELPFGRKSILSAKGGSDRCRFRDSFSIARFEGSQEPLTDQSFSSQTTTNPAMIRFFNIGVDSSSPLVNGVFASVRLSFLVQFYARTLVIA